MAIPLLFCPSAEAAPSPQQSYAAGWDNDVGLWITERSGGKTLHSIRGNAWLLVAAGLNRELERVPVDRVLDAIRAAQQRDGANRGNFWWFWTDGRVTDRNSAFFTGLALLVLRHEYGGILTAPQKAKIEEIFRDLEHWFRDEIIPLREDKQRYPNKFLGDLVCHWLLAELSAEPISPEAEKLIAAGLDYYRQSNWGWGEHLSDLYVKVCQYELLALLAYGRRLPPESRELAATLLQELINIDGCFSGGPRVPTLRCYAMDTSPRTPDAWQGHFKPLVDHFRPWIRRTDAWWTGLVAYLAYQKGTHERFVMPARQTNHPEIPCYGGERAMATMTDCWRLGAMTRYPLAIDDNQQDWGLHWQSMPVAFWHTAGDWGYLQWMASENGVPRALPAFAQKRRPSCILSDRHPEAGIGQTRARRGGNGFLILRRLPVLAPTWPWAVDRFRLVHATAATVTDTLAGWQRCSFKFADGILGVSYFPLAGNPRLHLDRSDPAEISWTATLELPQQGVVSMAGIWHLAVDETPPPVTVEGHLVKIDAVGMEKTVLDLNTWEFTTP